MLKNISPEEIPPISTTGTNGSYTYALDPSTGIYTLPGFAEEDTLPLDNTSLLLGVGAVALGGSLGWRWACPALKPPVTRQRRIAHHH